MGIISKMYQSATKRLGHAPLPGSSWVDFSFGAGSREYAEAVKAMLDKDFPEEASAHVVHCSDGWYWIGGPAEAVISPDEHREFLRNMGVDPDKMTPEEFQSSLKEWRDELAFRSNGWTRPLTTLTLPPRNPAPPVTAPDGWSVADHLSACI